MYAWEDHAPGYVTGLDAPPWYTFVPALAPLGMAEWGGKQLGRGLRGSGVLPPLDKSSTDWSGVLKVGAVVGIGVVGYFLYRSIRGGARTASSAIRGGMSGASE